MRAGVVLAVLLVVVGCGGDSETGTERRAGPATAPVSTGEVCRVAARAAGVRYELCYRLSSGDHARLYALEGGERRKIAIDPPFRASGPLIGHWEKALLSPDGRRFLLEWSAECEVPFTFVVGASGGEPQPVFGSRRAWWEATSSSAVGWHDARTVVVEKRPDCGGRTPPERVRLPVPR